MVAARRRDVALVGNKQLVLRVALRQIRVQFVFLQSAPKVLAPWLLVQVPAHMVVMLVSPTQELFNLGLVSVIMLVPVGRL